MSNTAKKRRFEESQLKKAKRAGLKRYPGDDEEIYTVNFSGKLDWFKNNHLGLTPEELNAMIVSMLCGGAMKLASGEELRNYVPQQWQGKSDLL